MIFWARVHRLHSLLFVICWAALVASGQQPGLRGIVVNGLTGQPLAKVQVHLLKDAPEFAGLSSAYGAMTDSGGRFSIQPMNPGRYFLRAEQAGFLMVLPADSGPPFGQQIELSAGQQIADLRVEMTPRAIISGRVVNEAGDPVRGIDVLAIAAAGGDFRPWMGTDTGTTDDRGMYRMSVVAGKYRIRAEPRVSPSQEPEEIRTDGTSPTALPVTWYPQADSASYAAVVEAVAGQELSGRDIRMAHVERITVSGVVTGLPEGARAQVELSLLRFGSPPFFVQSGADGRFTRPGLEPGTYNLWAETKSPELRSPIVQLVVSKSSVTGIELALHAAADLSGSIEMPSNILATDLRVDMIPQSPYDGAEPAQPAVDGTFKVEGVHPGNYEVRIRPDIPDVYVKSISASGRPARLGVIDLRNGVEGAMLKIVLSPGAAHVTGSIQGNSTKDRSHVWLLADGAELFDGPDPFSGMESRLYTGRDSKGRRNREPDNDGKFHFDGLPPGKYRLFAIDMRAQPSREAILKALEGIEVLEVHEGDHLTRTIQPLRVGGGDGK